MCCGNYEGLEAALAVPSRGGLMARVFAVVPGAVIQIGTYGEASNDTPAIVPEEVAKELASIKTLRVERDQAPKASGKKKGS